MNAVIGSFFFFVGYAVGLVAQGAFMTFGGWMVLNALGVL
jgi:hypothetical protein